jgi:hypothetical protein
MRAVFAALLLLAGVASAQEGFPLDGTWRGEHVAANGTHRTIVLIMQWDGKAVATTINPGPNAVESTAELRPEGWKVQLKAASKAGAPISFEGAIGELGKYNRSLTGKWSEGTESFDIRFVRE